MARKCPDYRAVAQVSTGITSPTAPSSCRVSTRGSGHFPAISGILSVFISVRLGRSSCFSNIGVRHLSTQATPWARSQLAPKIHRCRTAKAPDSRCCFRASTLEEPEHAYCCVCKPTPRKRCLIQSFKIAQELCKYRVTSTIISQNKRENQVHIDNGKPRHISRATEYCPLKDSGHSETMPPLADE